MEIDLRPDLDLRNIHIPLVGRHPGVYVQFDYGYAQARINLRPLRIGALATRPLPNPGVKSYWLNPCQN